MLNGDKKDILGRFLVDDNKKCLKKAASKRPDEASMTQC